MPTSVQIRTPLSGSARQRDLVHGYVRTVTHNPVHSEAALADIRRWCATAGRTLGSVFVDAGVPEDGCEPPGFTGLVGVAGAGCSTVVVAHLHHLSWHTERARAMVGRLWALGTRLVVAGDGVEITPEYFEEVRALRANDGPDRWELCANLLAGLPDERGRAGDTT